MVLDRGLHRPCQQASVDAIWPRRSSPHAAQPAARLMLGPARCRLRSPAVSVKRGRIGPHLEIKAPPTRHAARRGTATRLRRIRRPLMTLDGKSARATPNTPPRVDGPHPSREYSPGHRTFTLARAPKREQAVPVPPMQTLPAIEADPRIETIAFPPTGSPANMAAAARDRVLNRPADVR